MPQVALTGNDTIVVAGRTLINFGDGDVATLEFATDLMGVKVGKYGNSLFALNAMGKVADMVLRVIRGSADDIFLQSLLVALEADPPSFVLLTGLFAKRVGDGQGNITNDSYIAANGVFTKKVAVKENVEGETEQAVSIYHIKFTQVIRAIM